MLVNRVVTSATVHAHWCTREQIVQKQIKKHFYEISVNDARAAHIIADKQTKTKFNVRRIIRVFIMFVGNYLNVTSIRGVPLYKYIN